MSFPELATSCLRSKSADKQVTQSHNFVICFVWIWNVVFAFGEDYKS